MNQGQANTQQNSLIPPVVPPPSPTNVPSTNSSNSLPIIGLILAVILPPLGLIISIIAWHKSAKNHKSSKNLAIIGTIVASVFSCALIVLGVLIFAVTSFFTAFGSGSSKPNQAQNDLKPIIEQVEQLGGQKVCDQGDNGYSLDNTIPNYAVYYKVSDNQLLQRLESTAEQQGFTLVTDAKGINQLQVSGTQPNSEHYNPNASYLIATNSGKELDITIDRNGSLPLNCTVGNNVQSYGQSETVSGTTDLVRLLLTLPSTN